MPAKATPPVFSSTSDLRDFVSQFNRYLTLAAAGGDVIRLQHLSVALPTHLYRLLNMEMQATPDGTFADVTERFMLAAGSPPRDAASEQAAFESATVAKDESIAAFAGRLSLMALTAYPAFTAEVRSTLIKRRFTNALAASHPHIYRTLETAKPATLAEAIDIAATQLRVDATISTASSSTVAIAPTVDKATTPSASSTTIVASTSTTAANAQASDSLADKMNDVLKHLRAIRGGSSRGGYNRQPGNYQRSQPQFNGACNNCARGNSPQNYSASNNAGASSMQQQQTYRHPYSTRFSRPSSAPPRNLQCFKCGENHYSRDCPNA